MSNYSQTTQFGPKDSLPLGNPSKLILGTDIDTELSNIASAIQSKYDSSSIAAGPVGFAAGTVALPGIYLGPDTTTGLYRAAANQVALAVSGANALTVSSSGLQVTQGMQVGSPTGGFKGAGTLNAVTLYQNGTALAPSATTDTTNAGNIGSGTLPTARLSGSYTGVTAVGNATALDDGGTAQIIGWRGVPINRQSGNYTLQLSDRGAAVSMNTGTTLTVPANVFSSGDTITIKTNGTSGAVSIVAGTGVTIYWANGTATTGNRTLAAVGIATLIYDSANTFYIAGTSLS